MKKSYKAVRPIKCHNYEENQYKSHLSGECCSKLLQPILMYQPSIFMPCKLYFTNYSVKTMIYFLKNFLT